MEESNMSMTPTESIRLIDWFVTNGYTESEAIQCLKYIATGVQQNPNTEKNPK